ncbi:MAG: peptidoglycan DD-metalloendopeptidase family protein [Clostridia bacterium]|nr:peptidoglycan DD-metalloendopeptidase family protein [Clostridia bacterium]
MNSNYKASVKITAFLLSLALLLCSACINVYARDFQAEIDAIEKKIDAANSQKSDQQKTANDLQTEIDGMQSQIDIYQEKIDSLNGEIKQKDATINQYEDEIEALEKEIDEANKQIDALNKKIDETYELLKNRLRASYMAGEMSTLEILLGAEDFESFLTRLELVSAAAKHDSDMLDSLEGSIKTLNAKREEISQKKTEQEEKKAAKEKEKEAIVEKRSEIQASKNAVDEKQSSMEKKVSQIQSIIANLDEKSAEYRKAIVQIQQAEEEFNRQQNKKLSTGGGTIELPAQPSNGNYAVSSKGMICPLQYSNACISSGWGEYSGHKGTDIITSGATGNTYGKEIRAAAAGTVIFAGKGTGSSWSYGNFVTIDHGNGVATRYAHCSSVAVSTGTKVSQGQVIAYVGNTGNVRPAPTPSNPHAGAHLHFEVILNGNRVNAAPWLPPIPHR